MSTDMICVDLSHHNDVRDLAAMKAAGILGIIHKCTEGQTYLDDTYLRRQAEAEAAGLKWGAYHFLKHGDAARQMAWFVQSANLPKGARVAIDYEDSAVTLDDLHDAIEWLDENAPDLQITVYGGHLLKEHIGRDYIGDLAQTSLWLAQYTTGTPSWPTNTWPHWTLWQYTDAATVSGVNGKVDGNRFNGTPENFLLWMGPKPQPEPVPPAPGDVVNITINVPEGLNVNIIVNGEVVA